MWNPAFDLQQREVLLDARADDRSPHPRQEDRLTPSLSTVAQHGPTMGPMILAAKPWFYWLGVLLFAGAMSGVGFILLGYYLKVARNKVSRITKE
jgi:hypothetical protein